jgi:hypothetical protein
VIELSNVGVIVKTEAWARPRETALKATKKSEIATWRGRRREKRGTSGWIISYSLDS